MGGLGETSYWGSFENYELVDILGPSGIYDAGLIMRFLMRGTLSSDGYPRCLGSDRFAIGRRVRPASLAGAFPPSVNRARAGSPSRRWIGVSEADLVNK